MLIPSPHGLGSMAEVRPTGSRLSEREPGGCAAPWIPRTGALLRANLSVTGSALFARTSIPERCAVVRAGWRHPAKSEGFQRHVDLSSELGMVADDRHMHGSRIDRHDDAEFFLARQVTDDQDAACHLQRSGEHRS